MTHIKIILACLALTCSSLVRAQDGDNTRPQVVLHTTKGDVTVQLYNETPLHRDRFLALVKEGFYNGLLFHRIIYGFMIQTGDAATRDSLVETPSLDKSLLQKIPAEIHYPMFMHKRGALCAAREGDGANPQRMSSPTQFYIVYGKRFNDEMLDKQQLSINRSMGEQAITLTDEVRDIYKRIGGSPHLDGAYTVFGEVVEGIQVVRDIDWTPTDEQDRPTEPVRIIKAEIIQSP